ncbi:hypothetical protein U1740_02970 [Aeromonas caviae]|uniref:hypothetical protein n=1 Tax=Aeromonas caviae TaxID=648 RepID=UPI0030153C7F
MNKLIPLTLAAVFALTSGFTMAATPTKAAAPHATQTKVVKKQHTAPPPTARAVTVPPTPNNAPRSPHQTGPPNRGPFCFFARLP